MTNEVKEILAENIFIGDHGRFAHPYAEQEDLLFEMSGNHGSKEDAIGFITFMRSTAVGELAVGPSVNMAQFYETHKVVIAEREGQLWDEVTADAITRVRGPIINRYPYRGVINE